MLPFVTVGELIKIELTLLQFLSHGVKRVGAYSICLLLSTMPHCGHYTKIDFWTHNFLISNLEMDLKLCQIEI